jgi:hypothetical protein
MIGDLMSSSDGNIRAVLTDGDSDGAPVYRAISCDPFLSSG